MLNLLSRCDAEASGASAAVVTYEVRTGEYSRSLTFCQHHADRHGPELKKRGWSPFMPTAGEQRIPSSERHVKVAD